MRQSILTEFSENKKFSKSLISLKRNNFFYKLYYLLLDFNFFYKFKKSLKYSAMTLISNFYDYAILFILTDFLGVFYLLSATISYISSIIISYLLNKKYTFNYIYNNFKENLYSFFKFFSVSLSAMILTLLIMILFVEILGINYIVARLIASFIILFYVYLAHSNVLKPKNKFSFNHLK
jgi:putative flippase GtrA